MEYLNQFHKDSTERCLKQIEEWNKSPMPSEKAAKQAFEMHKRIAEKLYSTPTVNQAELTPEVGR